MRDASSMPTLRLCAPAGQQTSSGSWRGLPNPPGARDDDGLGKMRLSAGHCARPTTVDVGRASAGRNSIGKIVSAVGRCCPVC